MNKALYIATSEPNSGKSLITLGLMRMLLGTTPKVGYFRPIIDDNKSHTDNHINTVISHFDLKLNHDDAYAMTRSKFVNMRNNNQDGEIIDKVIEKYKKLEANYDFVLIEGTDFSGEGSAIELDANILIAKNLGVPAVIVSSGMGKQMEEFIADIHIAYDSFADKEVEVLCVVANKIKEANIETVLGGIKRNLPPEVQVGVIPRINALAFPTVREIAEALDTEIIFGEAFFKQPHRTISSGGYAA
jgi:phosphate acetyltransferase